MSSPLKDFQGEEHTATQETEATELLWLSSSVSPFLPPACSRSLVYFSKIHGQLLAAISTVLDSGQEWRIQSWYMKL